VIDPTARIHPTADLESDVTVGPRTSIWHRAQVRTGARIGTECVIGRDAFIDEGVTLGDRVKIQNLALVYHGVTVEDGVFIGPNAILTNDRYPRAITAAGDLARADDWIVSPITLRHGCSIGAGAVVVAGTDVGRFATVGPRPRARRREPGPPHRLGLRLRRPPRGRRVPGRGHPRGRCDVPIVSHDLCHRRRAMHRRLTPRRNP
jgi:UDP-2-acetamido-3-amino-2,3-dideoxy-glucuronate N-acetyltransferase